MALGKLNPDQRKVLAEFCGNLSVAWLVAGIIGPLSTGNFPQQYLTVIIVSLLWSAALIRYMLLLLGK